MLTILILTVLFIFPIQGMQSSSQFSGTAIHSNPPARNHNADIYCTGIPLIEPSLYQIAHSPLGQAISRGDIKTVKAQFDKPSTKFGRFIRWLLTNDDRKMDRAMHCLIHAVQYPYQTTGQIVRYLWRVIKNGCIDTDECEAGVPAILMTQSECLILNAYKNKHIELLEQLVQHPVMKYGTCHAIEYAVEEQNILMLVTLIKSGAHCQSSVLIRAIEEGKEGIARVLFEHGIGLNCCDRKFGSPLHIAIWRHSPLVMPLINKLSKRMIHCWNNQIIYDENGEIKEVSAMSALDVLFRTSGYDHNVMEALLKRGARNGKGASSEVLHMAGQFRKKFGLLHHEVCMRLANGTLVDCIDTRVLGY